MEEEKMPVEKSKADVIFRWLVPLALIAFAVLAYYETTGFRKMPPILKRGIQPSDFPQLICGVIIFLSLLMAIFDPVKLAEKVVSKTWLTFGALAGFCLLLPLDLFLALGVFAAVLSFLWGERRAIMLAVVGLVTPTLVFFFFDFVFRVRFPRGILTNIWYG